MKINSVAIVGMGALGILFGGCIQEHSPETELHFLMDEARKKRNAKEQYSCNGKPMNFTLKADTEVTEPADLVLFSVKYTGIGKAVEMLQKSGAVGENTTILSLMNGIDSEEILAEAFGTEKIVYCVSQGMDAMRFGTELRYTKMGELHIGVPAGWKEDRLQSVIQFFDDAKVPYIAEEDILYRMWAKFMLNVGVNQTCMAYGVPYKGVLEEGTEPHETFVGAMRETVAIANAEGVDLSEADVQKYIGIIQTLDPEGTPSMGQDRIAKRPSEVDMFAGRIIKLAAKHGIPVPVNQKLYDMVQEIESKY